MSAKLEVVNLLKLALEAKESTGEEFIANVDRYLKEFDKWHQRFDQNAASSIPAAEQEQFRVAVEQLIVAHQDVVDLATKEKELVADELGSLHKRAQGLKSYVDRFPQRISVTGKRKG